MQVDLWKPFDPTLGKTNTVKYIQPTTNIETHSNNS